MRYAAKKSYFRLTLSCKLTRLLCISCRRVNSGKRFAAPTTVAPFHDLKPHRGVKEIDGKVLCRTVLQQLIVEAPISKTFLSGETCTSMLVTWQMGFKEKQQNMHQCSMVLTQNHPCRSSELWKKASLQMKLTVPGLPSSVIVISDKEQPIIESRSMSHQESPDINQCHCKRLVQNIDIIVLYHHSISIY